MAEYKHQQQDLRAGQQHLAYLQQEASVPPVVVLDQHRLAGTAQVALAEAGLEAYLQRQQQAALVAVQDLERQRLHPHQVGEQLQSHQAVANSDRLHNKIQYYKEKK